MTTETTDPTAAHHAEWQPKIAAHHVARHLDAIAELLPRLSAQGSDPLYDLLEGVTPRDEGWGDILRRIAEATRATAPVEPLSEAEQEERWNQYRDMAADMSIHVRAEAMLEGALAVEWRERVAMAKLDELADLGDTPPT